VPLEDVADERRPHVEAGGAEDAEAQRAPSRAWRRRDGGAGLRGGGEGALRVRQQRVPASVGSTPRPARVNSGAPTARSSRRTCSDSDGWA
jgi:hypothetical protein